MRAEWEGKLRRVGCEMPRVRPQGEPGHRGWRLRRPQQNQGSERMQINVTSSSEQKLR